MLFHLIKHRMKNLHFSDSADADTESEELMHWPNTIFLSPQLHSFCRASPPPGSRLMLLMRIYFYNFNAFPCTQGDNKANVIKCSLKLKFFKFHFKLDVLCVLGNKKHIGQRGTTCRIVQDGENLTKQLFQSSRAN